MSSWGDSHGDTRGPEHHDHKDKIRLDMESLDKNVTGELKDSYTFSLRSGLKFRNEKNGLLVALSLNGFFVNGLGSRIVQLFRDKLSVSVHDIKTLCKTQAISEAVGLNFLRKLLLFGLVTSN